MPHVIVILLFSLFLFPDLGSGQAISSGEPFDVLFTDVRIMDGSGNPWFPGDVGIRDGRIVAVGPLGATPARRVIPGRGRILAPGFIDLHSHAGEGRRSLVSEDTLSRSAPNLVAQGATTLVVNQDGRSPWPIGERRAEMEHLGIGPNAIFLVGHGTVRREVMGDDHQRPATPDEVDQMRGMVRQAMEEGAWGLGAAHEYVPGRWATTDEIVALVEEVRPEGGIYVVHERSSGTDPMWWWPSEGPPGPPSMIDAVMETIEVAERTGVTSVQTHIKARGANFWGSGRTLIQLIERARERGVNIWADHYPYNTSGSDGNTVLIPSWASDREASEEEDADHVAALQAVLGDAEAARRLRLDVAHEIRRRGDPENITIFEHPNPTWVGRTLHELAVEAGEGPVEMALRIQLEGFPERRGGARMRGFSMSEIDLELFAAQPWIATASDAGIALPTDGPVHARFYGTFPRKIRHYALDRGVLSLEDAIRSMTSLPAQILGLRDRGMVREGFAADLVLFDLDRIRDRADFFDPHQYPDGIDYVLVNGEFAVEGGVLTGSLSGSVLIPREHSRNATPRSDGSFQ